MLNAEGTWGSEGQCEGRTQEIGRAGGGRGLCVSIVCLLLMGGVPINLLCSFRAEGEKKKKKHHAAHAV